MRKQDRRRRLVEVEAQLRRMVRDIEQQPTPGRLLSVLDQLDEGEAAAAPATASARAAPETA